MRLQVSGLTLIVLFGIGFSTERQVGCAWLKIPVGAREAAMAGCGTATGTGPQALVYNPANSAFISPFSIQADYTKWFLDTRHQSLFLIRDCRYLVVGGGVTSFTNGKFEYRTDRPTAEPLGTFTPVDITGYFNLAKFWHRYAVTGITVRYFYSKIMSSELNGFGADVGVRSAPLKNLTIGLAVVDFGRTLSYRRDVFWLPARARLGIGYQLPLGNNRFTGAIDGSYFFYSQKTALQIGAEFQLNQFLSLRAGYDLGNTAGNLNFGLGLTRNKIRIDYAFSPLEFNLGAAHRLAIGFGY